MSDREKDLQRIREYILNHEEFFCGPDGPAGTVRAACHSTTLTTGTSGAWTLPGSKGSNGRKGPETPRLAAGIKRYPQACHRRPVSS